MNIYIYVYIDLDHLDHENSNEFYNFMLWFCLKGGI